MSTLFFDTETNGIGSFRPASQRLVQLGWIRGNKKRSYLINDVAKISEAVPHSIKVETCKENGVDFLKVFGEFQKDCVESTDIIGHNIEFDVSIILYELKKRGMKSELEIFRNFMKNKQIFCTMKNSTDICKLPSKYNNKYKFPKLCELYYHFFNEEPSIATATTY